MLGVRCDATIGRVPRVDVICLHGLGRTPSDWDGVRPALNVLGPTRAPALPPSPAKAVEAIDAAVPAGAVVIGHSMGAVLAVRWLHATGRELTALVLSGAFFPPARNGRSVSASVGDYLAHRVAYVRARAPGRPANGESRRALMSLLRDAARPRGSAAALASISCPTLVVHARDDHHVPFDFAVAAARRHPGLDLALLHEGGHHAHLHRPDDWLEQVLPWLQDAQACVKHRPG